MSLRLSAEGRLFVGLSAFGLLDGIGYWFLTYETAGSVLLVAFGVAAGLAAALLLGRGRAGGTEVARHEASEAAEASEADGPAHEVPLPGPGWAPLGVGAGLGTVAAGAAFGPWLLIAGLLVTLMAGRAWLAAVVRDADAAPRHERREPPPR